MPNIEWQDKIQKGILRDEISPGKSKIGYLSPPQVGLVGALPELYEDGNRFLARVQHEVRAIPIFAPS